MSRIAALLRDIRGQATVEFALASLFLFGIITVALDFGLYAQQRLRLGNAVEQGALIAFKNNSPAGVVTFIRAAADTSVTPNVTITCNGTTDCTANTCSCITATGGFTIAASCNATCPSSTAISGKYMKIEASLTYRSIVVPNRYLDGGTLSQAAVVRMP